MGYLLHILVAVAAQAAAESGLAFSALSPLFGLALMPIPHALASSARRAVLAGRFSRGERIARLLHFSPPFLFAAFVLQTSWIETVRAWTGAELSLTSWPELALVAAFAPYVALQVLAIDAEARSHASGPAEHGRVRTFQLRMFLSGLAPVALYVVLSGALASVPAWRVHVEQVGLYHALFLAALLTVLALALPTLLKNTWETVPMPPGTQRGVLDAVAARADFRARDIRMWRTGNLMANAAIVGVGGQRVVLFSDSLLSMLDPRELAAVFGHEIGHAKRHHVAVFLSWALAFFLFGDLLAGEIAPESAWIGSAILVTTLVVWALCFGWLSRRCELEADLYSMELLQDPPAMVSALERVGGRLRDVAGWRHFSTTDRVAFLQRATLEPDFAPSFRRRLRRIAWLGGALCLLFVGLELVGLVESFPEDRFRARLALGEYAEALADAEGRDDIDEELIELGRLGLAFVEQKGAGPAELVPALDSALELSLGRAELDRAAGLATLLVLLGSQELLPLLDALADLGDDPPDRAGAREALDATPEPWRTRLAPWIE